MDMDPNSSIVSEAHFESEVRRLAALIWTSGRVNRSPIVDAHERDAIIQTQDIIIVIEATVSRRKDKIENDSKKTNSLVTRIRGQGFACNGLLVTLHEPTAEQEVAAKKYPKSVALQSFDQYLARLFDASEYLQLRITRPFGSIQNPRDYHFELHRKFYIPLPLVEIPTEKTLSASEIAAEIILKSERFAILADFGSGKSMCLREIFYSLRDKFVTKQHARFPVYINLREHVGARYSEEILERHARDLGLKDFSQLVKAWRAGFVDLLLDGFDEFAAMGWSSATFRLRQLRRIMLDAVRKIIAESPKQVGIVVVGRQHYFDSERELEETLGLVGSFRRARIDLLSDDDSLKIVKRYGGTNAPDWIPSRALLLSYLAAQDFLNDAAGVSSAGQELKSRGNGWDMLLRMISYREAKQHPAIDAESVLAFLERLATLARRSSDGLGSFSESDLSNVFQMTCGFAPDDSARVLISRLPALASLAPESGQRRFVDPDIADAARAGDVLRLINSPFDQTLFEAYTGGQNAMGSNGLERLSYLADAQDTQPAKIQVAAEHAVDAGLHAVGLDILNLLFEWNVDYVRSRISIRDIQFEAMSFEDIIPDFSRVTFEECMFDNLHFAHNTDTKILPRFNRCLIGSVDGAVQGDLPKDAFIDCEVLDYADSTARNNSILQTDLPIASKVLLTVLNKLFNQAGRGRRENALYRGLDQRARGLVPQIIALIQEFGFASPTKSRNQIIWLPRRDKTRRVNEILSHPSTTADLLMERVRTI